jgi:hypothetical protein
MGRPGNIRDSRCIAARMGAAKEQLPMTDLLIAGLFTAMLIVPCVVANFGTSRETA